MGYRATFTVDVTDDVIVIEDYAESLSVGGEVTLEGNRYRVTAGPILVSWPGSGGGITAADVWVTPVEPSVANDSV